jgi:hypothetical protein
MPTRYRGIYLIDGFRVERFDFDIMVVASMLHRAAHGHTDASAEELRAGLGFLQARLDDWVDSEVDCEFFDEAVFNMCKAAVMEYRARWPTTVDYKILDRDEE